MCAFKVFYQMKYQPSRTHSHLQIFKINTSSLKFTREWKAYILTHSMNLGTLEARHGRRLWKQKEERKSLREITLNGNKRDQTVIKLDLVWGFSGCWCHENFSLTLKHTESKNLRPRETNTGVHTCTYPNAWIFITKIKRDCLTWKRYQNCLKKGGGMEG